MKTHLSRRAGLLIAALFLIVTLAGFSAEPAATIYNRKSGLIEGWSSVVWGNLTVEPSKIVAREAGGLSLAVAPTIAATPYAGLQLVADDSGGLTLSDALLKNGEVRLYLRNGRDLTDKAASDQLIQVMLSFQPEGGAAFNGQYEQVVLKSVPTAGGTAAGWQLVSLSIPRQLQGRAASGAPVKLHGVYVQYIEQPEASYFVGECSVAAAPSASAK